jgi:hypothetical protein
MQLQAAVPSSGRKVRSRHITVGRLILFEWQGGRVIKACDSSSHRFIPNPVPVVFSIILFVVAPLEGHSCLRWMVQRSVSVLARKAASLGFASSFLSRFADRLIHQSGGYRPHPGCAHVGNQLRHRPGLIDNS